MKRNFSEGKNASIFTASMCTPMINVVTSASSSWHISMLWNISLLTDLKNALIYCTVILASKYMLWIAEISPPVHLTVRFAQNHRRLTSWHNLHWRSVWEWENRCKNVEQKEIKEVQEVAHKSPSLNVTQKIRKTSWSEGEKDLKIWPAH